MSGKAARLERHEARAARALSAPIAEVAPDDDGPKVRIAHRFLTYRGDMSADLLANPVKGPDAEGAPTLVVFAHYDPVDDVTRVGLTFATVHDMEAQFRKNLEHALELAGSAFMAGARP